VRYEHQHGRINYCGPANFSMALNYWGWFGDRDTIGKAVKPSDKDKNVMPYELQEYITDNTPDLTSVLRYGGDIELLKRMVAAGFPVVVEKGIYEVDLNGKYSWMGHYAFVTGYDEDKKELIYQDTYQPDGAPRGQNRHIAYDEFNEGWRAFDYLFVVVYPYARESEVLTLLGDYASEDWAASHALDMAMADTQSLKGVDGYFAWFNVGTSHVALREYADAATAYDKAFQLYAALGKDDSVRPYRMMWYQTGPYKAYFYSGRYTDVLNLANVTLKETISQPVREESLYWRGQAEYMLGDTNAAVADYRAALAIHPNWGPAIVALQDLGYAQ
jgi:tetratricopeptide (TPR) repeat protein